MSKESNVRSKSRRVLLIGATGFVGRHLDAALAETNWEVRRATRDRSRADGPGWVYLDVEEASSIEPALEGCDAAIDLIHSIDNSSDYPNVKRVRPRLFAMPQSARGFDERVRTVIRSEKLPSAIRFSTTYRRKSDSGARGDAF